MHRVRCTCGCSSTNRRAFLQGIASAGMVAAGGVGAVGLATAPIAAAAQAEGRADGEIQLLVRQVRIADRKPLVDLAIGNGRFVAVQPNLTATAPRVIDAQGRAAIPGLLEPHIHLDKALLEQRMPNQSGTLAEAIRITGQLKAQQVREDVLDRSRKVLDMAIRNGVVALRAQPDVDPIQGLIGVETALALADEYRNELDLQIVAFPQEGILKAPGTLAMMEEALNMGASVVGGCPYNERTWEDTRSHIDECFKLAQKYDRPVDLHADFADDTSDPRFAAAAYIAQKTIDTGYQGKVTLGHMTSLASLLPDQAQPVLELLQRADINIVTIPATDTYLGGRKDQANPRRGLTPVAALRKAGVNVTYASNNIRNAFTPFGKVDPLQIGNMLAHIAQLGSPDDQAYVLRMATTNAARAMGIGDNYGLEVGKQADLVVLDTPHVANALLDLPPRSWVIKRGKIILETKLEEIIHK
ncbi:amidohydrolase family protein [Methylobacterium oxalidis]|uniref:N-acyl-D-amino-acid deacylase n=1 Tax=Methylobacterium oxalidis TaxID=944322 RepID=A0A512JCW3_9HYPH|nr:amidohydrolase family protein [Methylobacterium oxalidis]GEP07798.1 N-acyl-D-amino-acid deacylase [Methylobacterium oxalidis]GJE30332.1 Cytosine deaminase [Methylobacterium oxalidis]GLS65812.1 N-acyl-D-amino-acid deacylase [Methylobacterium oxalidis]